MDGAPDGPSVPASVNGSGPTYRLIYRSRDRIPAVERRSGWGDLFTVARTKKAHYLTGALLVDETWFVQTLEGEELVVRELFERIEADPRHDGVGVIKAGEVPERIFARWHGEGCAGRRA